jgi:sugar fermentation stimulation protein A
VSGKTSSIAAGSGIPMPIMWTFPKPLVEGTLLKRYQRFFADVRLKDGQVVTAHCANTGSMKTCWKQGDVVYLTHDPRPERKLAYSWELTGTQGGYIGINTARPNVIVEHALTAGLVPELKGFQSLRREVKYGKENSRIDLLLQFSAGLAYVEVKNTTLWEGGPVLFPDSVTERGRKHLRELIQIVSEGHRGVIFFFVNRPEGEGFAPADAIDPGYGQTLREAHAAGVEILAYRAVTSLSGVSGVLPVSIHL